MAPSDRRGFTLLEVLIAFAVLALTMAAVLRIFSGGLRSIERADRYGTAALLATSVLAATGREEPVAAGDTAGDFGNGYQWHRRIEEYREETLTTEEQPLIPYAVTVIVTWDGASAEQGVRLSTLRLVPIEADGIPPR